jgi:hypothetical protein
MIFRISYRTKTEFRYEVCANFYSDQNSRASTACAGVDLSPSDLRSVMHDATGASRVRNRALLDKLDWRKVPPLSIPQL